MLVGDKDIHEGGILARLFLRPLDFQRIQCRAHAIAEQTFQVGKRYPVFVGRCAVGRPLHWVERVSRNEPYHLCWDLTMGAAFLLTAERCQTLTAVSAVCTHYVTEDRFQGLLAPLVMAIFGRAMQRGFEDCAKGLKRQAETA